MLKMNHVEQDFPRGIKRKVENINNKPKEKKIKHIDGNNLNIVPESCDRMPKKHIIDEGMTVLACIRNITDHALEVELPSFTCGKVTINAISESLNIALASSLKSDVPVVSKILKSFFVLGQYVPCKLKSFDHRNDNTKIICSISPSDINSHRTYNSFKKGELIWAAVSSELDHGYQLDCEIPNCRIFLPIESVEEPDDLKIGKPIWCKIHKVNTKDGATILQVGNKETHLNRILTDIEMPLDLLLPGTKVELHVQKISEYGICGKFLNNYIGFIHESQVNSDLKNPETIKTGSMIQCYVFYVEQSSKLTFLRLRGLDVESNQTYSRGDKVSAQVIGKCHSGLYLKLNEDDRGWISNNRLIKSIGSDLDDVKKIDNKYPKGTKHQCVILSYNYMQQLFICGMEKSLLKSKYFTAKDFKVGEVVEGKVDDIKSNGIILRVGQAKGFVSNIHLTDSLYSEKLKSKFHTGKKVKAKVFHCDENKVFFTLKSTFVNDENCVSSLQSAVLNEIHPALVLAAKPYGLVISFYNNVEGFVPIREFKFSTNQGYKTNPSSFFYPGEVIKVRIVKIKPDKLIASLLLQPSKKKSIEIGIYVKGVVKELLSDGISVFIPKKGIEGFIPVQHLSIDIALCDAILETFKKGDMISNLIVIGNDNMKTILSRREALAYQRSKLKVPKFEDICVDDILRCSVESVGANGVLISTPIKNFNQKIFIHKKFITQKEMPQFDIQQSLIAKVVDIKTKKRKLVLSLKARDTFDNNTHYSVNLFGQYLDDVEYLMQYGQQNGWLLNEYKLAEKVSCTVKKVSSYGCLVHLPNGCQGLVVPSLCGSYEEGQTVEGIVLGFNYKQKYLELCLDESVIKNINPNQEGLISQTLTDITVHKLLTRDQYILAISRKANNSQLIYIPLKLYENNLVDYSNYYDTDIFRVHLCGRFGNKLVGVHKRLKSLLDHKFKSFKTKSLKEVATPTSEMISHRTNHIEVPNDVSSEDSDDGSAVEINSDDSSSNYGPLVASEVGNQNESESEEQNEFDSGVHSISSNGALDILSRQEDSDN